MNIKIELVENLPVDRRSWRGPACIVIGAGSGGVRASRIAASLGAKVFVAEGWVPTSKVADVRAALRQMGTLRDWLKSNHGGLRELGRACPVLSASDRAATQGEATAQSQGRAAAQGQSSAAAGPP